MPFLPVGGVGADWIDPFGDGGGIDNWGDILVYSIKPSCPDLNWSLSMDGPWRSMVDHDGPWRTMA